MNMRELVRMWFEKWEEGDYQNIPVGENFRHTSPYGTIEGKASYMKVVEANKDKFLGNRIEIKDEIYAEDRACVRYTITHGDFTMEVSEWLYMRDERIDKIVSYYNIEGEISDERKLTDPR